MFENQTMLDFGAGTGESTIYFTNWGAKCTLVEINEKAINIAKKVFEKYAKNKHDHELINTSIYEFETYNQFDFVKTGGVLAHTNDPEKGFNKLVSFLKPGGYVIYGDGNKAGNFQNQLQRLIIFKFASTWDEMVEVANKLFKEDLDRAQKFAHRTKRAIIFDKWVVPRLTNPSVSEVFEWFDNNNIKLYSSYPPIIQPILSDSVRHFPRFEVQNFPQIATLTEAFWMIYNEMDILEVPKILDSFTSLHDTQLDLTQYVDDYNLGDDFDIDKIDGKISKYYSALKNTDVTGYLTKRCGAFFEEVRFVLDLVDKDDFEKLRDYLKTTKELFRGGNGVRQIDFVGYKSKKIIKSS
jgi:SAM-dependent methyltransferase